MIPANLGGGRKERKLFSIVLGMRKGSLGSSINNWQPLQLGGANAPGAALVKREGSHEAFAEVSWRCSVSVPPALAFRTDPISDES